jgi:hypothetical protein
MGGKVSVPKDAEGLTWGEKIGAGGFSEVYKGSFKDGRP